MDKCVTVAADHRQIMYSSYKGAFAHQVGMHMPSPQRQQPEEGMLRRNLLHLEHPKPPLAGAQGHCAEPKGTVQTTATMLGGAP